MADRRRTSPDGSVRTDRIRKEPRRSVYDEREQQRMRPRGADELSSSSSSSSSYLDISRSYPPNKAGILTFFTAPSERRRLRKRRSKKGLFRISTGNSSSSSLDGDLAYGTGFIKQSKRSVRSRKGKEIDRERYSERERDKYRDRDPNKDRDRFSDRERPGSGIGRRPGSGLGRAATDAEILAVGAGLAKLARDQNKADLKARGNVRKSDPFGMNETSFGQPGMSRGLGPSKVAHGPDNDEDGWESASDDESDFSVNSALAFDNDNNPSKWKNFFGRRKYKPKSRKSSVVDPRLFGPENSLHTHVDGPVGFGDVTWNSSTDFGQGSTFSLVPSGSAAASQQSLTKLDPIATDDSPGYGTGRGSRQYYTQPGPSPRVDSRYEDGKGRESAMPGQFESQTVPPVGFNARYEGGRGPLVTEQYSSPQSRQAPVSDRYPESSRYQEPPKYQEPGNYTESGKYQEPRQYAEPSKYQEQSRFQDVRDSVVSGTEPPYVSRRPEPIPLQQPQPMTPVSQSIFEPTYPTRSDSGGILKKTSSSTGRSNSLAKAALIGVAGVTAGAVISSARDDRKERKREEELEDLERERLKRRESEKRESKDERRRDKRSTSDRDDKKEKSRDKDKKRGDSDEKRREKKQESRREETRDEKEERREKRREERRSEKSDYDPRGSTRSEVSVVTAPIDPFPFQVADDAFPTPTVDSIEGHRRADSVPSIVTVEREPDFTRKRSYSIKDASSKYEPEPPKGYFPPVEVSREIRDREERDRPLRKAEEILEEARHSTAPYDTAIMSTVIAAEDERKSRSERRRQERKSDYDDYDDYTRKPREQEPEKERDPIQEEADKAYREIVMARKIASEVIRQRTPSPNRSVVDKYDDNEEEEAIKIVTPPEMADQKKKGPYDAPNADFVHDYEFQSPTEVRTFIIPEISMTRSLPPGTLPKRDPDTIKPRPILNLVRPTPTPSPVPEKQIERSQPKRRRSKSGDREQTNRSSASEVAASTEREPQPRYTASDIVIGPRGNVVVSPTASTVSKGVTWGENETKHYEVESPSDHREEFVSTAEVRTREVPEEIKQGANSKTRGWSALAGTIMGIGAAGAVAAASGDSSTTSQSKEDDKKPAAAYEYRGVIVEPESPPRSQKSSPPRDTRQASPPAPGPKPIISQPSHMPGSFDDDIEFTAAVAAGLEDTGFNPNIVLDDPAFRRRDSPPGSNDGPIYRAPFAETVSDLGTIRSDPPGAQGFVIGEVASTPQDWQSVSPPGGDETPTKLSKKEQKKREKARRQSSDVIPLDETSIAKEVVEEPESYFVEPKLSKKEQKKLDKNRRQSSDVTPLEETPISREIEVVEEPESYFVEPKLSKKDQKKRDKEAQRQRSLTDDISAPIEPSLLEQIVVEPEPYFETPKKSKKSKNGTSSFDEAPEESSRVSRSVSVPVDAYADLANGDDEWATETKKSKKSKRDSDRYDSPARSVPTSEVGTEERSSSKKSKRDSSRYDSPARSEVSSEVGSSKKDKSKRRSESYDVDPTEVSLPPSTPSEASEYDDSRRSRKSSGRDSGIFSSADRGESRSVVSAGASRYDDEEPRKSKKKSRSGTKDDFDDTRSVASAPAGDDWDDSKKSKKKEKKEEKKSSGFFGFFGSKSDSGARDESPKGSKDDTEDIKKKKKKRSSTGDASSLYGGIGANSVNDLSRSVSNGKSNGNGSHHDYNQYEDGTRSDGEREKKKSRSRSGSASSKKDSFLGNAGTLGAGVGIAGAAVAIAAQQYRQSKAANTNDSERTEDSRSMSLDRPSEPEAALDPDIQHRVFRPSIDPQYGDLLPLPPSGPTSPNVEPIDELPELPDSRPGTPEADRVARDRAMSAITSFRKSQQETPVKSPSQSAVPVRFLLGNRSTPPSPVPVRSSPMQSPAAPNQEPLGFPKFKSRPTSWEGSKEFRPLYLVESHRRGSNAQLAVAEAAALPPSQSTSRSSSQHNFGNNRGLDEPGYDSTNPLSIDTDLARSASPAELLGSGQSTPKALFHNRDAEYGTDPPQTPRAAEGDYDLPSLPRERFASPSEQEKTGISGEDLVAGVAVAGIAAAAGHLFSSSMDKNHDASVDRRPSPVDAVTKDRSSYLLKSSPIPSKFDDVNTDSPIRPPNFSSNRDVLHSIYEGDIHGSVAATEEVQREREKALESLSGTATPQEQLVENSVTRGISEVDPSDDPLFTTSKKSKKDKRKGKGLSRSSTQDDIYSLADASVDVTPDEPSPVVENVIENTPLKTKADKKKGKKKSKSSSAWDEPEEEKQQPEALGFDTIRAAPDPLPIPPSLFPDRTERSVEPSSFQSSESIKGKFIARPEAFTEPLTEEETDEFHDALDETTLDASETISAPLEPQPVDAVFTSISNKDKKKDRKKSKSVALEPESTVRDTTSDVPSELHEEDVFEDAQAPVEETAEEFSFSSIAKKSKKDKKKNKALVSWDSNEPEEAKPIPETSREVVEDVSRVTIPPADDDTFFPQTSKKDKKKRKSQVSFDPEIQLLKESITLDSSKDILEDTPPTVLQSAEEDVSFSKTSKKDKKKRKSQSSSNLDILPVDESILPESSKEIVEDVPVTADQTAEDFSSFKSSKKDKKKRKSQIGFDQPDTPSTDSHVTPEPSRELVEKSSGFSGEQATHDIIPGDKEIVLDVTSGTLTLEPESLQIQHLETDEMSRRAGSVLKSEVSSGLEESLTDDKIPATSSLHSSTSHPSEDFSQDHVSAVEMNVIQEASPSDEFSLSDGKKSKKKKRKSGLSWEDEDSTTAGSSSQLPEKTFEEAVVTEDAAADNSVLPTSKKGSKNKRGSILVDELTEEPLPISTIQESEDPTVSTPSTSKKDKKKAKKSQSFNPDDTSFERALQDEATPREVSVLGETAIDDVTLDQVFESLTTSNSKKDKKKSKKSKFSAFGPEVTEDQDDVAEAERSIDQETTVAPPEILDDFTTTKKSKKKSKKSQVEAFESEAIAGQDEAATITSESPMESEAGVNPEPSEDFMSSKKNKKKSKKSQLASFDPDTIENQGQDAIIDNEKSVVVDNFADPEPLEEFTPSKKSKKKSRKSQTIGTGEEEYIAATTPSDESKAVDFDNIIPVADASSSKPTPIGGPGAWPATPATPQTDIETQDPSSKGYFASAAAVLPAAAAGAALLITKPFRTESTDIENAKAVDKIVSSPTLETEGSNAAAEHPESEGFTPDGLKAGYRDEQLSLARQLQEEFAGGNKKSKKDKKKRQSLPSTPDRLPSRSRNVDELVDDHHRARSLSIEPSAERYGESPINTERATIYSEEQLELARQMKADFDSKKAKKEKKSRKGRSLIQDDEFASQDADDLQGSAVGTPPVVFSEPTSKADGFAAGYQEDQLSLAKQLQLEFGSGTTSKKSKKDKKRRSTSQTPLEQEFEDNYFGDQSQFLEPKQLDEPIQVSDSIVDAPTPVRDGLAVGYKEDQLELARQMQEEFAAKNSKKDKKGKKRQSLLRSTTEDDFSSDAPQEIKDFAETSGVEIPRVEDTPESNPTFAAEPENELPTFGKKSKQEKKSKKRGSLLRGTTDDDLGSDNASKGSETLNPDPTQDIAGDGPSELANSQADDEFLTSKKSKKDRKGKKRDSSIQANAEDAPAYDLTPAPEDEHIDQTDNIETSREIVPEAEDDFVSSKKAKKEKKSKKRDDMFKIDAQDAPIPAIESIPAEETSFIQDNIDSNRAFAPVEADDDFAPAKKSKKEKKSKKRDSTKQDDVEEAMDADLVSSTADQITDAPSTPASREVDSVKADEDFAPIKKSKKEKKGSKRDSLIIAKDEEEPSQILVGEPDKPKESASNDANLVSDTTFTQEPIYLTSQPLESDLSATKTKHVPEEDLAADSFTSTKKSKKDKKERKRGSTTSGNFPDVEDSEVPREMSESAPVDLTSLTPIPADDQFELAIDQSKMDAKRQSVIVQEDATSQQEIHDTSEQLVFPYETSSTEVAAFGPTSDVVDDTFEDFTSSKKSKKDKKKRQSLLRGSTVDEITDSETLTEEKKLEADFQERGPVEPNISTPVDNDQDDSFMFSGKKSKKDKKKRESRLLSGNINEEAGSKDDEPSLDHIASIPAPEVAVDQPNPEEAENTEEIFGEYALSKKSKKDKKKRRDSTKTDSAEASGYSTPLDPLSEAADVDLPTEHVTEHVSVPEPMETIPEKALLAKDESPAPAEDEWGSFSRQSSKKGKAKGKKTAKHDLDESSGLSTPLKLPSEDQSFPTFSTHPTFTETPLERDIDSSTPLATKEPADEPFDDWEATKKSKKDKKRKGSLKIDLEEPAATKSELFPPSEPIATVSAEPEVIDRSLDAESDFKTEPVLQESTADLVDDWTPKKSKKDKKAGKNSLKAHLESTSSTPPESIPSEVEAIIPSLSTESTVFDHIQDREIDTAGSNTGETANEALEEWAPTKKSKKDKKKQKNSSKFEIDEPTTDPIENFIPTKEIDPSVPANSSQSGDLFEPAPSTSHDFSEKSQDEVLSRKDSKKSKKNKRGSVQADFEDSESSPSQPEAQSGSLQSSTHTSLPVIDPTEHSLLESPPPQDIHAPKEPLTEASADEPVEDWAPPKKSKKDKKKGKSLNVFDIEEPSGSSFVPESPHEAAHASLPAEEQTAKDNLDSTSEPNLASAPAKESAIEPFEEWGSTKKSKKDKKKSRSMAAFETEEPGSTPTIVEPVVQTLGDTIQTLLPAEDSTERDLLVHAGEVGASQVLAEEPNVETFEDFAPSKKSKTDKKKRKESIKWDDDIGSDSVTLQPLGQVVETTLPYFEPAGKPILEQAPQDDLPKESIAEEPVNEPFEEWAPMKKSKKDKKKRKDLAAADSEEHSGSSTPLEVVSDNKDMTLSSTTPDFMKEEELNPLPSEREELPLDISQDAAQEPDIEWEGASSKKSKKDKKNRKSGLSTPVEGIIAASALAGAGVIAVASTQSQPESSSKEASFEMGNDTLGTLEPENEWDFSINKKSKKDKKKRKSGLSTPFEEVFDSPQSALDVSEQLAKELQGTPNEPQQMSSHESKDPNPVDVEVIEPVDDWGSVPVKKSKKDKKRKSGLSTPVEEVMPEINRDAPEDSFRSTELLSEEPSLSAEPFVIQHTTEHLVQDDVNNQDDEWGASTKKSKKDKKKRKSGISTPVEMPQEPEKSSSREVPSTSAEFDNLIDSTKGYEDQDLGPTLHTKSINNEPSDEWSETFESKKSKKDKKKRKSGVSTPIEEVIPTKRDISFLEDSSKTVQHSGPIDLFHATTSSSTALENDPQAHDQAAAGVDVPEEQSLDPTVQGTQFLESPFEEARDEDATEDPLAFVTKRSKKEKKGKRASKFDFESESSTSVPAYASLPEETIKTSSTESEYLGTDSYLEKSFAAESEGPSPTSKNSISPTTDKSPIADEQAESFTISRKGSKKDKRKRQPTIDASVNEFGSSQPPLTSWADDIEEAEVERQLPVIEEIAKDESLAHIPIMSPSTDDFVRPSKKGKKTSRRKESLTETPIIDASPLGKDASQKGPEDGQTDTAIIAAASVTAAAAAVLLSKAENSASSGSATPTRKLSKKEKKKMSIDKRAPREDMFDDPALWEGADPMVYEETKGGEDDAGSDGFWSPPQEEVEVQEPATRIYSQDEHSTGTHVDTTQVLSPPATPEPHLPTTVQHRTGQQSEIAPQPERLSEPSGQNSRNLDPSGDVPEEFFVASLKKGRKEKKSHNTTFEVSEEQIDDNQRMYPDTAKTSMAEGSSSNKGLSFDEPPAMDAEHNNSSRELDQQDYTPRRALSPDFERHSPVSSRINTPRSSRPRLSDLPIVHEENPNQLEAAHRSQRHDYLTQDPNRDSGFSTDSPIVQQKGFADHHERVRDSGVHLREDSPAGRSRRPVSSADDALARLSWPSVDEDSETVDLHRSQRPKIATSKKHAHEVEKLPEAHDSKRTKNDKITDVYQNQRKDYESTSHERPENTLNNRDLLPSQLRDEPHADLHRTPAIHGRKVGESSLVKQRMQRFESPDLPKPTLSKNESQGPEIRKLDLRKDDLQRAQSPKLDHSQTPKLDKYADLNTSPRPRAEKPQGISDIQTAGVVAGVAIAGASLGFAAARKMSQEKRPDSAQGLKSSPNINRLRTPDINRPDNVGSNRSATPPLRRTDRQLSGDLRSLSQRSKPDLAKEAELAAITASAVNTANPTANEGRVRAKDMADVYDGFGEGRMGSPRSPTRPHSMRRRQSMQVLDLESKVEQLAAENRMLAEAKAQAERTLMSNQNASSSLVEKDSEIDSLKRTLDWLQNEVQRLTEVNEGLTSANVVIARQHSDRYGMLEAEHAEVSRDLQETRDAHNNLTAGMDGILKNEVQTAVLEKDRLIAQLRTELDTAKERIREMQRQILASKANDVDFLTVRDEDYFDNACQQLCQHVQQWVLRFSKFSDMRACRLTSEINNDKTIDRLDNAILDGSDVDSYLADRVKRRDVFMSMTMTMVWEFVFTRYLFGMDREQRQKLKSLEKTLSEVGPQAAVHQWRATTLTLLAKRDAFAQQREQDTQAVVHAILETLSEILPPPSHLETQIEEQLTRVMKAAVDLSIEMRTQRAEYMMLPPLQPEYDANGDLASKVSFNSALMNERSGDTVSNEDLETQKAVVRIVLFPLVVKKGNDKGEGDEEIVVCPAQVLVAKAKKARFMEGNHSRVSMQSTMPAGEESVI